MDDCRVSHTPEIVANWKENRFDFVCSKCGMKAKFEEDKDMDNIKVMLCLICGDHQRQIELSGGNYKCLVCGAINLPEQKQQVYVCEHHRKYITKDGLYCPDCFAFLNDLTDPDEKFKCEDGCPPSMEGGYTPVKNEDMEHMRRDHRTMIRLKLHLKHLIEATEDRELEALDKGLDNAYIVLGGKLATLKGLKEYIS